MGDVKTVTISEAEYAELLDRSRMLDRLEAAGVDSWEGYQDCVEELGFPEDEFSIGDIVYITDDQAEYGFQYGKIIETTNDEGEYLVELLDEPSRQIRVFEDDLMEK
jgi:hypothetical protein